MQKGPFILSIDQGTTSSRIFLFDLNGHVVEKQQKAHQFFLPQAKFVEHDANEIWQNVSDMLAAICDKHDKSQIKAIGITNQRETIVCWDKQSGEVLCNAIVWQDNRTESVCEDLVAQGYENEVKQKTGLTINPYFSASKISWLLTNNPNVKSALQNNQLMVGTMDCFLMYRLSGGSIFKTDVTNASRTLLFNIETFDWDQHLLELFNIPREILPEVVASDSHFGDSTLGIPITGVAGDQQSALVGQTCFEVGQAKMTFGTGGFFLVNIGSQKLSAPDGLLTTVAYELQGQRYYAIEGSIFHAASIINWLQRLGLIHEPRECDVLYQQASTDSEVVLVPAFTGLGAPHWRSDVLAEWHGMTLSTGRAELVQSALQSIAFQSYDLFSALGDLSMSELRVDGGVSQSDCLLQLLADLSSLNVRRPKELETTVLGAMMIAGLGSGLFSSKNDLLSIWQQGAEFKPQVKAALALLNRWHKAVSHTLQ